MLGGHRRPSPVAGAPFPWLTVPSPWSTCPSSSWPTVLTSPWPACPSSSWPTVLTSPWSTVPGSRHRPRPCARQTDALPPGPAVGTLIPPPVSGRTGPAPASPSHALQSSAPAAGLALALVDPDPATSAWIPLPAPAHDRPDPRRRELGPRRRPSRAVTAAASCGSASSVDGGRPVAGRHGRGRVPRRKWR
jgi:hypothetical protein